jgi:rhodanese-related sulfurtransferase
LARLASVIFWRQIFSVKIKLPLLLATLWGLVTFASAAEVSKITPTDAAKLVASGKAVVVDVREPSEWAETGVVTGAVLLPKSDFDAKQALWKPFLEKVGDKEIILYCRSGRRAGAIAAILAEKGYKVANAGGLDDWTAAGQPVQKPAEKK